MPILKQESEIAELVRKAERLRDREHRLKPSLRLKTLTGMVEFVHARGLVTTLGGNELPSMISAVLGREWKPSGRGFSGWLDWWSLKIEGSQLARVLGEIERRNDILASRIFRRSKTFVSNKLWPLLDPIIEHHMKLAKQGRILSSLELKILKAIELDGSIRTDRLREKLGLDDREHNYRFHRSLTNLESHGIIVGAEDPQPERHLHANVWQTWKRRTDGRTRHGNIVYEEAVSKLLERTIDACLLVREDMIRGMFEWHTDIRVIIDRLIDSTFVRAGAYIVSSRVVNAA